MFYATLQMRGFCLLFHFICSKYNNLFSKKRKQKQITEKNSVLKMF